MSKYTKLELQIMARTALNAAQDRNDDRWLRLVLGLSLRLGLRPDQVEVNIAKLAGGVEI